MLACVLHEIRSVCTGARVEKVFMPEKDEVVLLLHCAEGSRRLLINAGCNHPRIGLTETQKENPLSPPMLCMLLRKHLTGARLSAVRQEGFERVARLEFEGRDEMGFACRRSLIAEMLGKYSNLIFADEKDKVLSVLYPVDFSTSSKRQILPGMTYELPPAQEKRNPMETGRDEFAKLLGSADPETPADRWLLSIFSGVSSAVAREIVYRAAGKSDCILCDCPAENLTDSFFAVFDSIRQAQFCPCMVLDHGQPIEYSFLELTHYGDGIERRLSPSVGSLLDAYFETRDREAHLKQKAADLFKLLTSADTRIRKKLSLQRAELEACEKGELYRRQADLLTANLHAVKPGAKEATLIDYEDWHEDGSYGVCRIVLDPKCSPAANAQRLYKKYAKAKHAKIALGEQISIGEAELAYLDSVFDSLTHAETASDLSEIRDELSRSGYASRLKLSAGLKKPTAPSVAKFRTSGGFTVYCGKNNLQNEYVTHKLAAKSDYWFHAKKRAGSHVVLICDGKEPGDADFTEAATIAAVYSKAANGENVEVDYTLAKNVKKPAGGKPGFVIYHTNWSCVVTPDPEKVRSMRIKEEKKR